MLEETEKDGPTIAWEWPLTCAYWQHPAIRAIVIRLGLQHFRIDGCMVGNSSLNTKDVGTPMKKPWRISTSSAKFGELIHIVCDARH